MADDSLNKNLKSMESSGYLKEDLKIDPGSLSFSLDGLKDIDEEKCEVCGNTPCTCEEKCECCGNEPCTCDESCNCQDGNCSCEKTSE